MPNSCLLAGKNQLAEPVLPVSANAARSNEVKVAILVDDRGGPDEPKTYIASALGADGEIVSLQDGGVMR